MTLGQGTIDRLACAVFENYKVHRRRDGKTVEYEEFEEQPEDYRHSCREQALSYVDKVRMLGYEIIVLRECDDTCRVRSLSDDEIELLAREEHSRWVEERVESGWSYGPEKDVEQKTSPFLVPWSELSESVREYDRLPIREMIALLESAGLAVTRRDGTSGTRVRHR